MTQARPRPAYGTTTTELRDADLRREGLRLAIDEPGWYWLDSQGRHHWVTDAAPQRCR